MQHTIFTSTLLAVGVFVSSGSAQDNLDGISVDVAVNHVNNVPNLAEPYVLELWAWGSTVTGCEVTPPIGNTLTLAPDFPWGFFIEDVIYQTNPIGLYDFSFTHSFGSDGMLVDFSPTQTTDFAHVSWPQAMSENVPIQLTFQWDSVVGFGSEINIETYDITADWDGPYSVLPITETSWTPPADLEPGHWYQFEISISNHAYTPEFTNAGDDFVYHSIFNHVNSIYFRTSTLYLEASGSPGGNMAFAVTGATPNRPVAYLRALGVGLHVVTNPFSGNKVITGLSGSGFEIAAVVTSNPAGDVSLDTFVPAAAGRVYAQAVDIVSDSVSNVVAL